MNINVSDEPITDYPASDTSPMHDFVVNKRDLAPGDRGTAGVRFDC